MDKIYDLRSFMSQLENAGQLTHIHQPVHLDHEMANVAATLDRRGMGAVLFERPSGRENIYSWPVFTGAVTNQRSAALALGCEPIEVTEKMGMALDPSHAIMPIRSDTPAPWHENIITGENIDINRLPIPTHGQHDGGPFITGGITVSHDPVSGRGNLSYNRMQILGPRTFGFNVNEWRHTMQFYKIREARNEPLHAAIAIGLDPAISIAGGARYDDDELAIAGAIRGEPVLVARCQTVEVWAPFHSEIVIEGYLPPHTRRDEGPLAEFHGYYGEMWNSPVFEVTAICYRSEPIYQTIVPGWSEHIYIGNVLPREPLLLRFVRHVSKNVTGLHIPPYANGFTVLVQLDKSNPGEPKNVAMAAFTAHVNIAKVIVVDPDVNIYDPADVLWALTNRMDAYKDVFLVPGAQGHEMDPTADSRGVQTKVGIDATYKPERRPYGERIRYPAVDLSRFLD
jgi:2,5-furandicarboxylate decarboxylase 1